MTRDVPMKSRGTVSTRSRGATPMICSTLGSQPADSPQRAPMSFLHGDASAAQARQGSPHRPEIWVVATRWTRRHLPAGLLVIGFRLSRPAPLWRGSGHAPEVGPLSSLASRLRRSELWDQQLFARV